MKIEELYSGIVNDKKMSLSVSKYNAHVNQCEMFNNKEFIFIGISLGNSYFNEERLELIIKAFSVNFKRVAVFLVDKLSAHNYRAMGYNEKKIHRKVRTNTNLTVNRIQRAIKKTNELYKKNNIKFYRWEDIENFKGYPTTLEKVVQLYEADSEFQNIIYETTKNVVEKYLHEQFNDVFFDESKWYFLKELAMGLCLNDFLNENNILNCYYQDFKFFREFFESDYLEKDDSKKQDFIIYHCSE